MCRAEADAVSARHDYIAQVMQDGCCRGLEKPFCLVFELHIARTMNHVVALTAAASRCFTIHTLQL
jgi:hypothetical protein